MMRSGRIGHKKSRNGCRRCKARHVKCDEQQPCRNCVRHKVQCSLSLLELPPMAQRARTALPALRPLDKPSSKVAVEVEDCQPAPSPTHQRALNVTSSTSVTAKAAAIRDLALELEADIEIINRGPTHTASLHKPAGSGAGRHVQDLLPDWMRSLRLLHHYYTSVCLTLSKDQSVEGLWKITVPEIAFSHEFLMNGLLAISALHYAHTHPDQRKAYVIVSTYYENRALECFSARLNDINEENCEAYFLLASFIFLLTTCSIANPQDREESITPNDVAQSFVLLQGIKSILAFQPIQKWREEGPLAPLLQPWVLRKLEWTGPFQTRLEKLSTLVRELPPSLHDINVQSACLLAIESLRTTYASFDQSPVAQRRIWLWPFTLPQTYIELLGRSHPVTLVILAHYAALAKRFEGGHWSLRGWSASIMAMIVRALGEQWKGWIEWPMRCLGEGLDVDNVTE